VGSQKKKKKKLHLSLVECTKDVHHHTSLLFFGHICDVAKVAIIHNEV
jgi:hypothetical protein